MNREFWTAFAQVAATLAGFTLASFSIYTTRAEMAGADQICRRYSFKESASNYSWVFTFIALITFLIPLLLSLLILMPTLQILPWAVPLVRIIVLVSVLVFMVVIIWMIFRQIGYIRRGENYRKAEATLSQELAKERPIARKEGRHQVVESEEVFQKRDDGIRLVIVGYLFTLVVAIPFIFACVIHALWQIGQRDPWGIYLFWEPFISRFPAELVVTLSLVIGMILIYWHFHFFDPENLLFSVEASKREALIRTKRNVEEKCGSVRSMQQSLLNRVRQPDNRWLRRIMIERCLEMQQAEEIFANLVTRLEGWHWNPETNRSERLLDREGYHLQKVDFIVRQPYITYGGVTRTMSGLEKYIDGLGRFESDLKEISDELQALVRFLDSTPSAVSVNPVMERTNPWWDTIIQFVRRLFA